MDEDLILAHLPLVRAVARHLKGGLPAFVDEEDLISAGCIGLIAAAERYDPATSQFSTFAKYRIRGEMLDMLRRGDFAKRGGREIEKRVEKARDALCQQLGRSPDAQEIAAALDLPADAYTRLTAVLGFMQTPLSIEAKSVNLEGEYMPFDKADPSQQADRGAIQRELAAVLEAARSKLTTREQEVIQAIYDHDLLQFEVAAALKIGFSRISQIHTRAIRKLRGSLIEAGYRP